MCDLTRNPGKLAASPWKTEEEKLVYSFIKIFIKTTEWLGLDGTLKII